MAKRSRSKTTQKDTAANVGYEAQLWQMADALRGSTDAAEYKHVGLGLVFLKYISDAFEEQLVADKKSGADPEAPDEHRARNIFSVPPKAVGFLRAHANGNGNGGKVRADISIYGQESNYTTWRLAKMNLAIRGIEGQIAHGATFHDDCFPDLKAGLMLANPPLNVSDWGGERLRDGKRCRYGTPSAAGRSVCP